MKIIHVFETTEPTPILRLTYELLFDELISQYYSENKVNSTTSSEEDV